MELSLTTTMPIMLSQIAAMFMMVAVGAICFQAKFISREGSKVLTNIATYVSTPAAIIRALAVKFDPALLGDVLTVCAVTAVLMVVSIAVAHAAFGFNGERVPQIGSSVSNMGFIGIPLVESVIGSEYVVFVSACIAVQVLFIWTYVVCLYARRLVCKRQEDRHQPRHRFGRGGLRVLLLLV
nr:AEC family transporter [Paratractidigestivibacter sp.]